MEGLERCDERVGSQRMDAASEFNLALEFVDVSWISLDACVAESNTDRRGVRDVELELRARRHGRVAQEGTNLFDGEAAIAFDLEF